MWLWLIRGSIPRGPVAGLKFITDVSSCTVSPCPLSVECGLVDGAVTFCAIKHFIGQCLKVTWLKVSDKTETRKSKNSGENYKLLYYIIINGGMRSPMKAIDGY